MGRFTYQTSTSTDIEDRALAHLQVVIAGKLRRRESFIFTWKDISHMRAGRVSVWMNQSIPVSFKYFGSRTPTLNKNWLEALAMTANSATGLYLIPEPAEPDGADEVPSH